MDPLTIHPRHSPPDNGDMSPDDQPVHKVPERNDSFIVEVFKFAVLALIIVVPFRMFIAQPFIVSGASMDPTFKTNQYLIVDQITYHLDTPKRGDIVVFRYPNDPSKFFIKRIIGLPGEVVELANGNTTIIDPRTDKETLLEESYLVRDRSDDHISMTLSSDEYFVMGDNRGQSSDSRVWGPVPRDNMVGRVFMRLLPPGQFGLFPGEYSYEEASELE